MFSASQGSASVSYCACKLILIVLENSEKVLHEDSFFFLSPNVMWSYQHVLSCILVASHVKDNIMFNLIILSFYFFPHF